MLWSAPRPDDWALRDRVKGAPRATTPWAGQPQTISRISVRQSPQYLQREIVCLDNTDIEMPGELRTQPRLRDRFVISECLRRVDERQ